MYPPWEVSGLDSFSTVAGQSGERDPVDPVGVSVGLKPCLDHGSGSEEQHWLDVWQFSLSLLSGGKWRPGFTTSGTTIDTI